MACVAHPFGSLATRVGPMALRPRLATGLPLSRMKRQFCTDLFRREKCSFSSRSRGHPPNCFDTTVGRMGDAVKFGQGISLFLLRLASCFCAKRGPAFSPGGAADNNLANGSAVGGESTTAAAGGGGRRAAHCIDAVAVRSRRTSQTRTCTGLPLRDVARRHVRGILPALPRAGRQGSRRLGADGQRGRAVLL